MDKSGHESELEFENSIHDGINEILTEVRERGRELLSDGLETAKESIEEGSKVFKEKAKIFSEKTVKEISDDARSYVRKNPLKSVAIAAGVGLLIGLFLKSDR